MKRQLFLALFVMSICFFASGQSSYFADSRLWLEKSEDAVPPLIYKEYAPLKKVVSVQDAGAYQGWRMEDAGGVSDFFTQSMKRQSGVILDFGEHITGHLTFSLRLLGKNVADAPVRLKFTFAEMPAELNMPFDPYPGGLSRAWLQDETYTLMTVPVEMTIPRRVSFRYLKIEVLGASSFDFAFDAMTFKAQSSVSDIEQPLRPGTDPLVKRINEVSLKTLKECMQTVYEDGPKRDRRLWIGDLYLEALANACTFKNHRLTKRCLYLLGALANDDGLLHANVFEYPSPHPQYGTFCLDYALLYNVSLLEYLNETNDLETAADLWPVAVRQIEMALRQFSSDWLYDMKKPPVYWLVFDWKDNYDRHASMQGLTIFALNKSSELAERLGKEKEAKEWAGLAKKMKAVARKTFYDSRRGLVISGDSRQVSYLSQVWMILSGTLTKKEGAKAMKTVLGMDGTVYPGAPYAYHYVMEALLQTGLDEEARKQMLDYWGGMVDKGADTFWEVYDPNNDGISPYGFFPINSYCHAWSCTPTYFIHKYPGVFQR